MNKKQLKTIAGIINQTNANEKTRAMFNVINGNAYFTPDGNVGYKLPMNILYDVEDAHGITIPEASGKETIYNAIETIDYSICYYTELNAKEFLAELKAFCKQTDNSSEKPVYKIQLMDRLHAYQAEYIIDALTILGNKSIIYMMDETFGNMYIFSEVGASVILPRRIYDGDEADKVIVI